MHMLRMVMVRNAVLFLLILLMHLIIEKYKIFVIWESILKLILTEQEFKMNLVV